MTEDALGEYKSHLLLEVCAVYAELAMRAVVAERDIQEQLTLDAEETAAT
jgi:hypothetical protein